MEEECGAVVLPVKQESEHDEYLKKGQGSCIEFLVFSAQKRFCYFHHQFHLSSTNGMNLRKVYPNSGVYKPVGASRRIKIGHSSL